MAKTAAIIPLFREINECHAATGFPLRTDTPQFHVFTLDETYPCSRQAMPPYRRGFYQLTLFSALRGATLRADHLTLHGRRPVLIFSPPEQALSWVCGEREQGFMLYFKAELFPELPRPIEEVFPFFASHALHVAELDDATCARLHEQFERLCAVARRPHPYRLQQLAALSQALLYDCRALHDQQSQGLADPTGEPRLVGRFHQMVAECFQAHCSVEDYARCLHVSADHLSALVKQRSGRTAREWIAQRRLHEAKRLLSQTDLTVSEISDHLQFSVPTHFARFFRRGTGKTPLAFRRTVLGQAPAVPRFAVAGL